MWSGQPGYILEMKQHAAAIFQGVEVIIRTPEEVAMLLEFINANEMLAYDTETTGLNPRKDTIIGFGISNAVSGFYVPIYRWDTDRDLLCPYGVGPEFIKVILSALARKQLLTFNASFDMRFTKYNLGTDLLPALHTDVLLLKHTVDEEFPFGLKEIGKKIFGAHVTEEQEELHSSIKANGGTGKQYYKASTDVLAKYCIQDCFLTFKLYSHYRRQLDEQRLTDFYYRDEVLPLYKEVTIPMEEAGICLDMPKIKQADAEIKAAISTLEAEIQAEIEPLLGKVFEPWFLHKDYPLKTYKGNLTLIGRMYFDGYTYMSEYEFQKQAWRKDNEGLMFNLQSKHHLKKLFFDTLKETPLSKTPTGQPQVDEEFLELMAPKYSWCSKLIEFNKLSKIQGTYIARFLEENEDGRYYPSFMQHRTVSGRYAGDMQQLPRPLEQSEDKPIPESVIKFTNLIREFIVPGVGSTLISADYEQLEPTIFAHTSGDPALQRIFNDGTDFYSEVAIRTERLSDYSSNKTAINYLAKANKALRQKAKSYALGIAYGMSGYKLKFEINCTEEEAETLVQAYYSAFPKLKEWMDESRNTVKRTGEIRTQSGRVRHMPRAKAIYERYGPCIDHDLELWKAYHSVPSVYEVAKRDRREYKNLLNNAINFQVQGLAASIVNRAAIALARKGYVPRMQVHDELVYEVPESDTKAKSCIQEVMENIINLSVPLRTVPQSGKNYRECK